MLIKESISSSHGEQYGGWRKEQSKNWCDILTIITKYSKLSSEEKLLIFDCFMLLEQRINEFVSTIFFWQNLTVVLGISSAGRSNWLSYQTMKSTLH